jgi:hypothetical protein
MLQVEIIGSARSTYTRVARMACEEKGIDYVLIEAELGAPALSAIRWGEHHRPGFRGILTSRPVKFYQAVDLGS